MNTLRYWLDQYDKEGLGGPTPFMTNAGRASSWDPTSRNGEVASAQRRMWAEKMMEMEAKNPRQPDAYDMEQQGNAQANALRSMLQASQPQGQYQAPPLQAPQDPGYQAQRSADGMDGRNYGQQIQQNALQSMQDYIAMNNQAENGRAQRDLMGAQTQRMQRPMPQNLYPDRPMPQMPQRQANPMIENYLARLMGGR